MKKKLEHFKVGEDYGGNQDRMSDWWMRIGGCAALTACDSMLYYTLVQGSGNLLPDKIAQHVIGRDRPILPRVYETYAMLMKTYLRPRFTGVDRLDIFVDGLHKYLNELQIDGDGSAPQIDMTTFSGDEPVDQAQAFIRRHIDAGHPVPTLILNHQNKAFEDYIWHWFLINGYEEKEDNFIVRTATMGTYQWLSFPALWNTGKTRKGGLIGYESVRAQ